MFEVNKFQTSSLRFVTEYHMLQFKSMAVPNGGSIMLHFKPKKDNPWWKRVFDMVRIPEANSSYKTIVNHTYIP